MRSEGPMMVALPPFRGVARRIVLMAVVCFFALLVLGRTPLYAEVMAWLALWPHHLLRAPWTLVTYAFLPTGVVSTLFALLSVWMFGASMEDERGSRWFAEYFLITAAGGGLLASLVALTGVLGLVGYTAGLWPFVIALMVAFATMHPDEPLRFNFILTLKAKYLAAIYLLVFLGFALAGGDRFGAATAVAASLCGWASLRMMPRRGLGYAASEQWYGLRNAYYRSKRRRAAKKFQVYMKKQGREVHFDASGRYVDPDDARGGRDANDKRWMN